MNDEVLTIKVTEAEVNMIMDALHVIARMGGDTHGHDIAELRDLEHDLMEQVSRHGDGWGEDLEPTEIAEDVMFNAGVTAREQVKRDEQQRFGEFDVGTSKAAERRNERMMRGTTATLANDPVDW